MNKVDFTLNNGRVERMHPKIAELLQRKGKGTYQTRVVQQAPQRAVLVPQEAESPAAAALEPADPVVATQTNEASQESVEPSVTATLEPVDLASLSVEQLREYAKRQGVQVHHRAGTEKIIEAIEKKAEE